jgi:hypothetical protein
VDRERKSLCLEDHEALGLWKVDDTRLPVLVSKQQKTAHPNQAYQAGAARCPNAAPELEIISSSPYWC